MKIFRFILITLIIEIFTVQNYAQNFDSLTNFVGNNVKELKGLQLEVLARPNNVIGYGYQYFYKSNKILSVKYPLTNTKLVYKKGTERSEFSSNYNALVHKIFTVSNVILSNDNYFLELKNEKETIYFLYDTKYEMSFPFLIIGYYEKFKESINEKSLSEIVNFKDKYGVYSIIVDTILINNKLSNYSKSEIENRKLIQSLMVKTDEFTGVTWVSLQPYRYNKLKISIHPYIAIYEDKVDMRLGVTYKSDDWLFIDKIYLLADGEVKLFNIADSDNNREVVTGK